ncbi:MAG TPA: aldolase/citrate lyase family protein [Solirubrobacteraceae bacterium]|nr:aldolase/citrate lyase family protein [Solirubrobacteraceae bacterium]
MSSESDQLARALAAELDARLADADRSLAAKFPGNRAGRQPVHTVYTPADKFEAGLAATWSDAAQAALDAHRELFSELVADDDIVKRVEHKLAVEPIEDLRLDFEDGYGNRPDATEDDDVRRAATALVAAIEASAAPPSYGIRIKSLEAGTRARALRTLIGFLRVLADGGVSGQQFVVTLPKVTSVEQVQAMVYLCEQLEADLGVRPLRFEIQVETPQSVLAPDGSALVARMVHASGGRCSGLHYGTYDYSAFCGIAARYQSLEHPAADHAKAVMQAAAAGTGVRLSDGSTNVLPIGDPPLVRRGWELHLRLVQRSLRRGYYQGWDLHAAQLPTRFAATYAFYRDGLGDAQRRLHDYLSRTGSAILDEPATARALADYVLRALHCGAATAEEVQHETGLDQARLAQLAGRAT